MAKPYTQDNSSPITFTTEENRQIDAFVTKIDIHNSKFILSYAGKLQKEIAKLPTLLLEEVKDDSSNQINELVLALTSELSKSTLDKNELCSSVKAKELFESFYSDYLSISDKVSSLSRLLKEQEFILLQNASLLAKLHQKSLLYYKKLCMFIEAGQRKLQQVKENHAEMAYDLSFEQSAISRFENRLANLRITKTSLVMFSQQISMYRENNENSQKKIQEIQKVTIPAWKRQCKAIIQIGDILEIVTSVSDSEVGELLASNADLSFSFSALSETLDHSIVDKKIIDELFLLCQ